MKRILLTLLLLTAILSLCALAKDTVYVVSDLTTMTEGNLNVAVSNVISADPSGAQLSNTVFKLEPYGYYILTATITTPAHSVFTLVADPPGQTQETAPPQIVWSSSGGVTTTFNFDCGGDVVMKYIWILSARSSGGQVGSSLVLQDDSLANLSGKGERLDMEGCIYDYMAIGNGGGAIEPACKHFKGRIVNTYFRNFSDPHYRYYGRPVSWTYQSTTWHTDSLIFENCTFANCGYVLMQESPEYSDHVSFNHCTFVNTVMFGLESTYWWWLSITNSLFVNIFMYGDIPSGDGANAFGNGGILAIDSVQFFGFSVPFADSLTAPPELQRHVVIANNSYGHEEWYIDYLNSNPFWPANEGDRIHRMPAFNTRTYNFLNGTNGWTDFPYISMANMYPAVDTIGDLPATYTAETDPGFILNPCNIDSIKAFLQGRWTTGKDVNWAYDPTSDIQQIWPMNEILWYTNATLKTAAMDGSPLGDLYNWWPTEYAAWKTQSAMEHRRIDIWLATGNDPGPQGVPNQPGIPVKFEMSQNYPNPFNPTTQIDFSIPKTGYVSLKVYNLIGQEVATLYSSVQQAGNYTAKFDGSGLASGVYLYELKYGNASLTKKLILMK